jgi:hypothetical protein
MSENPIIARLIREQLCKQRVDQLPRDLINIVADYAINNTCHELGMLMALPPTSVKMFADRVNWVKLARYQAYVDNEPCNTFLPIEFISTYAEHMDWDEISSHQRFSIKSLTRFADRVNWQRITLTCGHLPGLIDNFHDRIHWPYLTLASCDIDAYLNRAFYDEIKYDKNIRTYVLKPNAHRLPEVNFTYIARYDALSETQISNFRDVLNWSHISRYQTLTEDFITRFAKHVNWKWITYGQILSDEFTTKFAHKVDWNIIRQQ